MYYRQDLDQAQTQESFRSSLFKVSNSFFKSFVSNSISLSIVNSFSSRSLLRSSKFSYSLTIILTISLVVTSHLWYNSSHLPRPINLPICEARSNSTVMSLTSTDFPCPKLCAIMASSSVITPAVCFDLSSQINFFPQLSRALCNNGFIIRDNTSCLFRS